MSAWTRVSEQMVNVNSTVKTIISAISAAALLAIQWITVIAYSAQVYTSSLARVQL